MCGVAHHHHQFAVGAGHLVGEIGSVAAIFRIATLVVNTGNATQFNHIFDFRLIVLPVLVEHARGAGHCNKECVGCNGVFFDGVLWLSAGAIFGVVIFNESHGVAAIRGVCHHGGVAQLAPVVAVHGVAHGVAEGEVEGCRLNHVVHLGAVNPVHHRRGVAVPVFAH